jgi:hypothetical protein
MAFVRVRKSAMMETRMILTFAPTTVSVLFVGMEYAKAKRSAMTETV